MKRLLTVLGVLLLLLVIAAVVLGSSLGSIVKGGINRVGPQLTQSKVEVADADVSALSGEGTLTQLVIGNPAGWQSSHAFSLAKVAIDLEPRSLMGDHIVVNTVLVDSPDIIFESRVTSSNLQDLMKNIQAAAGGDQATQPQGEATTKKIEVKHFRLQNARITVMGAGNTATVTMPELVLENLGTAEGGLTPQQLAVAVMKEVTAQAVRAAGRAAVESGLLEKGLNKLLGGEERKKE